MFATPVGLLDEADADAADGLLREGTAGAVPGARPDSDDMPPLEDLKTRPLLGGCRILPPRRAFGARALNPFGARGLVKL
mmetsp:Transcript_47802/g.86134  ORF Transcript_47802/g.86134 Transcript_47802/m.86134 type:complete len:80 (+) Transcript_47802:156-395(+)